MDCSTLGFPVHHQLPWAYSNSCPSFQWCHPTISSSVIPFSCLQSSPASRSFLMSQLFTSGDQSIEASASASVLPMNIKGLISFKKLPLGFRNSCRRAASTDDCDILVYWYSRKYSRVSVVAQMVKNLPAVQKTWVQSLGWEDPLEKGTTTHSSILAWRIPWTEEPGGLLTHSISQEEYSWEMSGNLYGGKTLKKNRHMDMYNWITLLYTWN